MISIFKLGGPHKKDGINYHFKAINMNDLDDYLNDGWHREIEDLFIIDAEFEEVVEAKPLPKLKKKVVKNDGANSNSNSK